MSKTIRIKNVVVLERKKILIIIIQFTKTVEKKLIKFKIKDQIGSTESTWFFVFNLFNYLAFILNLFPSFWVRVYLRTSDTYADD